MIIAKQELRQLVDNLPEEVEIDEVLYRLYLREKLEAAEEDVEKGRLVSHEAALEETDRWFAE